MAADGDPSQQIDDDLRLALGLLWSDEFAMIGDCSTTEIELWRCTISDQIAIKSIHQLLRGGGKTKKRKLKSDTVEDKKELE